MMKIFGGQRLWSKVFSDKQIRVSQFQVVLVDALFKKP